MLNYSREEAWVEGSNTIWTSIDRSNRKVPCEEHKGISPNVSVDMSSCVTGSRVIWEYETIVFRESTRKCIIVLMWIWKVDYVLNKVSPRTRYPGGIVLGCNTNDMVLETWNL